MASHISYIAVHPEGDEKNLLSQGLEKINVNLNKGGSASYLWVRRGGNFAPITRIQLTFNAQMSVGLINAGYTKIPFPIQFPGADPIYIWFFQGSGEYHTPIVDLDVTLTVEEEAQKFQQGWEKLACDLRRRAGGDWIYVWVKRERPTYICDVAVTDSFKSDEEYYQNGYIRVDEDARRGVGREYIFTWYRQTTDPQRALSDLKVSTNESEFQDLQLENYLPVNLNFQESIGSHPKYLWYKKERAGKPIKVMSLVLNTAATPAFTKAGINVIEKNLNAGIKGRTVYLCFHQ